MSAIAKSLISEKDILMKKEKPCIKVTFIKERYLQ